VSDRKDTPQDLAEFEPKFKIFTEQSPNMIFINKKGKVVYANKKCEELMGYTREEFLSADFDFMDLIAPESVELIQKNFELHQSGKEVEPYEYGLINKNREKIDAIITSKLINYEGETAILGIVTDITQRKRADEELRKSEEKFRQAFQNAPIGMALSRMDDRKHYLSDVIAGAAIGLAAGTYVAYGRSRLRLEADAGSLALATEW